VWLGGDQIGRSFVNKMETARIGAGAVNSSRFSSPAFRFLKAFRLSCNCLLRHPRDVTGKAAGTRIAPPITERNESPCQSTASQFHRRETVDAFAGHSKCQRMSAVEMRCARRTPRRRGSDRDRSGCGRPRRVRRRQCRHCHPEPRLRPRPPS